MRALHCQIDDLPRWVPLEQLYLLPSLDEIESEEGLLRLPNHLLSQQSVIELPKMAYWVVSALALFALPEGLSVGLSSVFLPEDADGQTADKQRFYHQCLVKPLSVSFWTLSEPLQQSFLFELSVLKRKKPLSCCSKIIDSLGFLPRAMSCLNEKLPDLALPGSMVLWMMPETRQALVENQVMTASLSLMGTAVPKSILHRHEVSFVE